MARSIVCLLASILLIALAGCSPAGAAVAGGAPELTYTVSPCQEGIGPGELAAWARVDAQAEAGAIHVTQNLSYVCCARVELSLERSGNLLKLVETNTGEMCRCMCGYVVDAQIKGLPSGSYTVQVWGVRFEDMQPELLSEVAVTL